MNLLEVKDLQAGYGAVTIIRGISLAVRENELVCILGRNGVGKSTLIKAILGLVNRQDGTVAFDGQDITRHRTYKIARLGIGYVPQGREVFENLTVEANLRLGSIADTGKLSDPAEAVLDFFPVLRERRKQQATTLSGGEQQMLAIARVLASRPRLILCDEPSEGLQPSIIDTVATALSSAAEHMNLSVLLVEQNIQLATTLCSRGYIMDGGKVVQDGPIEEITSEAVLQRHIAFTRMSRGDDKLDEHDSRDIGHHRRE